MSSRRKRAAQQPKRGKLIIPFGVFFVLVTLLGLLSFSAIGAYAVVQSWLTGLPSLDGIEDYSLERKSRIWASDGTLLGEIMLLDREPVAADKVSPNVFNATIAVEDERFLEHKGVDYFGIARAAVNDLTGGDLQGASTITQQLVRQTILLEEANVNTLERKVREAALALELEKKFEKEDILMLYLNTINYGDGAWGVQSAAQHYYSKDASQLTVAEAALIAGIPQNPTYNNPVAYPENALKRRNMVLDRMLVNGYINETDHVQYRSEELNLKIKERKLDGIYAEPYFTSYVRHVMLNDEDFPEYQVTRDLVFRGGLDIYTTIDRDMQVYAEEACADKEWALIEATGDTEIEVSLCAVDPKTGHILAMRGGKDFYADQFNTCWQMQRQCGSSFKVFAMVAALEQGYSPQTPVMGTSPIYVDTGDGGPPWRVENYQGGSAGRLTLASATWQSSNTAYARIVKKIGAESMVDVAHRLGITTEIRPVMSAVLGAEGVNTLEMASAFGTLSAGGVYYKPTCITKITDHKGNVIFDHENHENGVQAVSSEVASAATQILTGVVTGGTGTSASLGWQVSAGKTGTADNYWDSWYVGYTPQISCAIWIGARGEQRYIADNVGGANCCPVWRSFMSRALEKYDAEDFSWAASPVYDPRATFLTAEEVKAEDDKKKKEKEEEEAEKKAADDKKKKEEEAAKKAADDKKKEEEEKKKEDPKPPTGGGDPGGDPGGGGGSGGGGSGG